METIGHEVAGKSGVFGMDGIRLDLFRPHKYPMVLLEEVTECSADEQWLTGIKRIRPDDPYVQAHFPGDSFMPPAFVVEALAQAAGALMNVLFFYDRGVKIWEISGKEFLTLGQPPYNVLGEAKIKHVGLGMPGETITLHVKIMLRRKDIIAFHGAASVGARPIASGELMLAYPPYTPPIVPDKDAQEPLDAAR
jgi:3-hydroxymyristoyl/3-hydroxydecanoyl-(acyl carrier protein) dehydratase